MPDSLSRIGSVIDECMMLPTPELCLRVILQCDIEQVRIRLAEYLD